MLRIQRAGGATLQEAQTLTVEGSDGNGRYYMAQHALHVNIDSPSDPRGHPIPEDRE